MVVETDAKDHDTTFAYDARNRRVATTDRINATTAWTWDANGNELSMTDAESQTTSYAYDLANRKTKTTWPDHVALTAPGDSDYGITEVAYDALGRVLRTTDQLGDTITRVYDLAGRMTDREYRLRVNSPSGTIADADAFTYDGAGRVLTAEKGRYSNTVEFTYDDGGRIATEALKIGMSTWTIEHEYDNAGRRSKTIYPSANEVDFAYTDRGQLDTVTRGMITITDFTYDGGGRETSRTHGNSLVTNRTYVTGENLLEGITVVNRASLSHSYTYDANKNVETEDVGGSLSDYSWTAGYDDEDRLTSWNRDGGDSQNWTLSSVGDWSSFTENTVTESRTYNDVHELTAIDSTLLSYDPKGNLTEDDEGIDYVWDFDNMLAEVIVPMGANRGIEGTHSYEYDALGRRVSKTVDGTAPVTTVYVQVLKDIPPGLSHGGQVVAEYENGTLAREYVYGEYVDEPLVLIDRTSAGSIGAGTDELFYYHQNRVYNVIGLTDASGNIAEYATYTPYGEATLLNPSATPITTSAIGNLTLFTGRIFDAESSLHYFRARYLTWRWGFISRDPLTYVDGSSLYRAYFAISMVDPHGTDCTLDVCSSPVPGTSGKGGHFFIVMDGIAYRGGPQRGGDGEGGSSSSQNNRDEDGNCECPGKFGQLLGGSGKFDPTHIDHPDNPDAGYDKNDMKCNTVTIEGKSCDNIAKCFKGVLDKLNNECCIPYSPIPIAGKADGNSNSTVVWMLEICTSPNNPHRHLPRDGRVNPGSRQKLPNCLK